MREQEPLAEKTRDLIARAGSGDRRAMESLILAHQQRIARFVIAQTGDSANYEDLCQIVFVKMVLGLPRLRSPDRFEAWLFQIARNACRDHARSRRGWRNLFTPYETAHDRVAESKQDANDAGVDHEIERLPPAQRSVLRLSLDGRRSYEELARLTASSVSAVKSRLHRARENLRAAMAAGDSE